MNTPNYGERIHTGMGRMMAALVVACFASLMIAAPSAFGAEQVITSAGPLTNIYLSDDTACQADHADDSVHEFYPEDSTHGDCGTFLWVGGEQATTNVYGPQGAADGNARLPYDLVSQSAVTGSGTTGDPYQVVTAVDAGTTGLGITQTDSYVTGDEFYRTDIVVSNSTGSPIAAALYHAGDCFLQESDEGNGFFDSAGGGGIYCSANVDNTPPGRIEGFVPLSSDSNYVETNWPNIWSIIDGTQFPNTCACATFQDNAAGLSWDITVPANGSVTRSLLTAFSPTGEPPPADGVGDVSARGTDPDATLGAGTVAAQFSAISNCDETQVKPFYVRWTSGGTNTFKKAGASDTSTCFSSGGANVNEGTGSGLVNGSTPATVSWHFADGGGPDDVQITVTPSGGDPLAIDVSPPDPLSGTPGGVWVRGDLPWPAAP